MVGFGPMLLDETQIVGIDVNGNYVMDKIYSMNDAKLHMLKIQKLMIDQFGIEAELMICSPIWQILHLKLAHLSQQKMTN